MKYQILPRAALAAALAVPLLAFAQEGAKAKTKEPAGTIAVVNGVAIPQRYADVLLKERAARGQPESPGLKEAVREELINRELLEQAAKKAGITKDPDVRAEMALAEQTVLVESYLHDWLNKHPISDADVQKEYDANKARAGGKEYHAEHILVPTEAEAKKLIAELDKGASFEELAKKNSTDEGTKERGGDLGWYVPAALDPAFADAMVKLQKGKYTETPVKTQFGYHIIKLEDTRPVDFPPLDKVKPRIVQSMTQREIQQLIQGLRAKAKIQ
jgi:peptidyl-prolyl cis-trans isomerase C